MQRQVEGIVYATMYHREVHPPEGVRQVPTVLLDLSLIHIYVMRADRVRLISARDATAMERKQYEDQ